MPWLLQVHGGRKEFDRQSASGSHNHRDSSGEVGQQTRPGVRRWILLCRSTGGHRCGHVLSPRECLHWHGECLILCLLPCRKLLMDAGCRDNRWTASVCTWPPGWHKSNFFYIMQIHKMSKQKTYHEWSFATLNRVWLHKYYERIDLSWYRLAKAPV